MCVCVCIEKGGQYFVMNILELKVHLAMISHFPYVCVCGEGGREKAVCSNGNHIGHGYHFVSWHFGSYFQNSNASFYIYHQI